MSYSICLKCRGPVANYDKYCSTCQVIGAKSDGPWAESNGKMRKWHRQLEQAWEESNQ